MPRFLSIVAAAMCLLAVPPWSRAESITVAAASDLSFALRAIAARFEKQSTDTVKLSFGSSGTLSAQIENGAPFDIFFSADREYPARLASEGYADPGSQYLYATGKLVLWAPEGGRVVSAKGPFGKNESCDMNLLKDLSIRKIALANPQHAPYGRAAVAALRNSGIYETVKAKLVLGENISQAAQFVQSGNADVGILALSLALSGGLSKGTYCELSPQSYPRLEQIAVITAFGKSKRAAYRFLEFMKRPEAQAILKSFGFAIAADTGKKIPSRAEARP